MGKIVFSRVDFRLIHGQVVTRWIKLYPVKTILIVDDFLGNDPFMADIYEMAAPPGTQVLIVDAAHAKDKIAEITGDIFLLSKNIETMLILAEQNVEFSVLDIGGAPSDGGKTLVTNAVFLNQTDIELLEKIEGRGVQVVLQATPEDTPLTVDKAKLKLK